MSNDMEAPWFDVPYLRYRTKQTARVLNVSADALGPLRSGRGVRFKKIQGRTGTPFYVYNREDVIALALRIRAQAPS